MLAALRLILFDEAGDPLKAHAFTPLQTWLIVGGGFYGVARALWDLIKVSWKVIDRPGATPSPFDRLPPE